MEQHRPFYLALVAIMGTLVAGVPGTAQAFQFEFGEVKGSLTNVMTIGASMRMEERDPDLIGKSNLQPGLCLRRTDSGAIRGNTCNSSSDPSLNEAYVAEPGSFSPNGDNGNLNYDKGDIVSATAKLASDLSLRWGDFGMFVRGVGFFDEVNDDFEDRHPDTTFQPARTDRPSAVEEEIGSDYDVLDAYVFGTLPFIGDRELTLRVGEQVINWGESTLLLLNSINTVNPPDANRLRQPGFQIAELFTPIGAIFAQTSLTPLLTMEAFYQYDWEPATPDAVGSFFSTSDIAGAGGSYAMLSFGKAPEDPDNIYDPSTNSTLDNGGTGGDPTGLLTNSGRTVFLQPDNEPEEGGQYGVSLRYFAENINNGTDFGLYYINYHSRFPLASVFAADETCLNTTLDLVTPAALGGCGALLGDVGDLMLERNGLPVDTLSLQFEYPEDIELYGLSFNTTVGNWALQGEYAYRPNLPLQIHTTDLIFAGLQPAFPEENAGVTTGALDLVIPNKRASVPDYVETLFRGNTVQAGDYIQGYERMKVGQFDIALLRTFGGTNFLQADQIIFLLEAGFTHVVDMPGLDELQFNGPGLDTHISAGADGTPAANGNDSATLNPPSTLPVPAMCGRACRQNPTSEPEDGFPDDFSWGIRYLSVFSYQDVFWGVNLDPVLGIFWDVDGTTPGPGGNFIEDRVTGLFALRFDYLNKWSGELRYTLQTGGDEFNDSNDRDTLSAFVAYEF